MSYGKYLCKAGYNKNKTAQKTEIIYHYGPVDFFERFFLGMRQSEAIELTVVCGGLKTQTFEEQVHVMKNSENRDP